jgi:phospholipid/cholesterol/gamma-HCH transport system substrate-binding protein
MSIRRARRRVVALAATSALLLSGCEFSVYDLPLPGGADVGEDPYEVTVKFRDVLDLVPQSSVKVDDITVGRVDEVELDGYAAEVTLVLRKDVKLPGNAVAEIRQTSLLGEKFVSLSPPPSNPSSESLGHGDVIGLNRSGNNVEVEEVLGAMSLLLNGGGVGQLKIITNELNQALSGREGSVKSVLEQTRLFMAQLDDGKSEILTAIERVNSLAVSLNKETPTLDLALKELPSAIASVDRQRDDLIKMLRALNDLSSVGTRVIQASKAGTVESLDALAPILTQLGKTGDALVNSLQILLTFPFMDSVVGKDPARARDLHMGDYMNLSIDLDLNLSEFDAPGVIDDVTDIACTELDQLQVGDLCRNAAGVVVRVVEIVDGIVKTLPLPKVPGLTGGRGNDGNQGGQGNGGGGNPLGPLVGGIGLGRAAVGAPGETAATKETIDRELAAMLVWGVTSR